MESKGKEYFLADAARMFFHFEKAATINPKFVCLYSGDTEENLKFVAPYLFIIDETEFIDWLQEEGWGNSWGIQITCSIEIDLLKAHFRRFLMVKTEEGIQLYFRFYDPRVLRIFLPTCDTQQLKDFFGPIHFFFMEDEDPNFALKFSLKNGQLHTERIKQNLKTTDK